MEAIVITWRELLLVIAVVLAVYIAEMLLVMRASGSLRKPRWLGMIQEKKAEAELRRELEALRERVARLESSIKAGGGDEEDTPYNRAILMARHGHDAKRLAEECGISRGEAELIVSMQKR
ncbi:MAG TPA: DUF2802 domain-containing protein [Novimethylophilus sp.]|uniref:DUF2802 domain-containing protein n=1 Tax=Novimethylophilus sp. TaxID=2137426 RepID=UPI002F3F38FD